MNLGQLLKKITTNLSNKVNKTGDTMSGDLHIENEAAACYAKNTSSGKTICLHSATSGNKGLYDIDDGIWTIMDGGENIYFPAERPVVFRRTTDAAGSADKGPAVIIGGMRTAAHIEIDSNEIVAKSNGTTETVLYLNETTANVRIGGSTVGSANQPVYINAGKITACTERPYVVSQHSDVKGYWNWRIWSDGFKECWVHMVVNRTINNAWGILYESQYLQYTYPSQVQFTYIPVCIGQVGGSELGAAMVEGYGHGSTTQTPRWHLVRPASTTEIAYPFNIYACGY